MPGTTEGGPRRGRPPRVLVDRELVVDAALQLLASEGTRAVTMRRVAGHLDVPVMTLYGHVNGREHLLDLLLDEVLGRVEVPAPSPDWRADVIAVARSLRRVLLEHRDAPRLLAARPSAGPNALDIAEFLLDALVRGGLSGKELVFAYTAVRDFALGSTLQDATWAEDHEAPESVVEAVHRQFDLLPADRYPRVRAALDDMLTLDGRAQFDYAVSRLVDGLAP